MTAAGLARVDWRFLLPHAPTGDGMFAHALVLGATDAEARLAREIGVARRVSTSLSEAAVAAAPDLVVVRLGAEAQRRQAIALLRPGGVAYVEHSTRRELPSLETTIAGFQRRAARDGLELLAGYGVWPGFDGPTVWLPVLVPRVLSWYAATVHSMRTRRERARLRLLLGAAGSWPVAWRLVTNSFAWVARRPGGTGSFTQGAPPSAMLCHGDERVVVLPFNERGVPREVLKIARHPKFNSKNESEQRVVAELRSVLPPALAAALPAPLGLRRVGDAVVAVEEYVAGRPVVYELAAGNVSGQRLRDIARDAGQWLAAFHTQVASDRGVLDSARRQSWFVAPAGRLDRSGAEPMVAPLLGRIREALGDLETTPVPTVVRHRDYTPWNVIRSPGGLRVLDWEGAGPGAPVEDLIHFLTHWHEIATNAFTGEDRGRAIVALFCDPSATEGGLVTHARMLVREYALQLGIDARWIPIFIAQTFVTLAARHLAGPESVNAEAARLLPEFPLIEALGAHGDDLFATWSGRVGG